MASPTIPISAPLPRPAVRRLVSVLVALHVAVVFIGPWAMPPQASQLGGTLARLCQPYLEALFLANGYRFFAPEPGPSHLVRYELTMDDGTTRSGVFPDRQQERPRLLYHRYFMLSEFVNTLETGAPRPIAEAYAQSYAKHLARQYEAKSVALFLRRHYVPRMSEVQQGMKLTDKKLYEEHPLVTYTRD